MSSHYREAGIKGEGGRGCFWTQTRERSGGFRAWKPKRCWEWLSCLWSWLWGLKAHLPSRGGRSLAASSKSELVLEFLCSLVFLCLETWLGRRESPLLTPPPPPFLSSECSLKWDPTLVTSSGFREPEEQGRAVACEDLPMGAHNMSTGCHDIMQWCHRSVWTLSLAPSWPSVSS